MDNTDSASDMAIEVSPRRTSISHEIDLDTKGVDVSLVSKFGGIT